RMANLATKAAVGDGVDGQAHEGKRLTIHTPLIALSKAEIIGLGTQLGVDYSLTSTCYDPSPAGLSCGGCDACQLRLKGFAEAGLEDPAPYQRHSA
ncbi:MAG: 7-cyano-7-deazaguanine synthase, partial [Acidobacteriota bacterium]